MVLGFFGLKVLGKEDESSCMGEVVKVDARQVKIYLSLFDNSIVEIVETDTV